jgi:hypothetical protein
MYKVANIGDPRRKAEALAPALCLRLEAVSGQHGPRVEPLGQLQRFPQGESHEIELL